MARLSRGKKRDQQRAAHPAAPVAAPIEVHVPASGPDAGAASVGGVRVVAAPGEEVQQAVLTHLYNLAFTTGHAVHAVIHDERIGYVVPLQMDPDGASRFSADPVPMAPPEERGYGVGADSEPAGVQGPPRSVPGPGPGAATAPPARGEWGESGGPGVADGRSMPQAPFAPADVPGPPAGSAEPEQPRRDLPTHLLRQVDEPVRDAAPTFRMRSVPEAAPVEDTAPPASPPPADEAPQTFTLRALPEPPPGHAPGTVAPPTGEFGPPPVMDAPRDTAWPAAQTPPAGPAWPEDSAWPPAAPADSANPAESADPTPPAPSPRSADTAWPAAPVQPAYPAPPAWPAEPARPAEPAPPAEPARPVAPVQPPRPLNAERPAPRPSSLFPDPALLADPLPDPEPKPTPPRGFDAVAEAVLGDDPLTVVTGDDGAPPLLAEPLARINEAVKEGRTDRAVELADQTLEQAYGTLGPEHPEVLHLRELAAYIAYLADDQARSFQLSLDLAHARHRAGDAEAAYGNIQSAFTAWRAVRDPLLGLELGHDADRPVDRDDRRGRPRRRRHRAVGQGPRPHGPTHRPRPERPLSRPGSARPTAPTPRTRARRCSGSGPCR